VILLFFVTYVFSAKGYVQVVDTGATLDTAEEIVSHGSIGLPPGEGNAFPGRDGKTYSKYGLGWPIVFLPFVATAHVVAKVAHRPEPYVAGFFVSFINVGSALLMLAAFARVLKNFGVDRRRATLLLLALGLGTLCWCYAAHDFSEELQAALLLWAFEGATRGTERGRLTGGLALAALVFLKVVWIIMAPFFGLYVLASVDGPWVRRARSTASLAVPVTIALAAQLALNAWRFGNPMEVGYGHGDGAPHYFLSQLPLTIPALLVSPNKGLLFFCPVLVLGLLGAPAFARRYPREAALTASLVVVNLLFTATLNFWDGGWCWGPRYLVPLIPLWLLPAAFWVQAGDARRRFAIAAVLTGVSVVAQVPGVLVKEQEIHQIRYNELTDAERPAMVSDESASWVLFTHKLRGRDETYAVNELGPAGDRPIELNTYRTYLGFNVWSEHVARQMNNAKVRWLGILGLLASLALLARVVLGLRAPGRERPEEPGVSGAAEV
jgi:hypothetical protein